MWGALDGVDPMTTVVPGAGWWTVSWEGAMTTAWCGTVAAVALRLEGAGVRTGKGQVPPGEGGVGPVWILEEKRNTKKKRKELLFQL